MSYLYLILAIFGICSAIFLAGVLTEKIEKVLTTFVINLWRH